MTDTAAGRESIAGGKTALGIELGSTRIKAVLTDEHANVLASGSTAWKSSLITAEAAGAKAEVFSYSLDEIHQGVKAAYRDLSKNVAEGYGVTLERIGAIGISAMMHGYLAFDENGKLLVPFRTWQNTITAEAATKLTEAFGVNIPERWSIAHLYQALLNKEAHTPKIAYLNTLAGYIHELLTGERVLGVGDASGMFPISADTKGYDPHAVEIFDELAKAEGFSKSLLSLLPEIRYAGDAAGTLTEAGARFLDETGTLEAGSLFAPPEGDAGTGMTATNAVAPKTGNVSAGTSVFAMVVLEGSLKKLHREIDMVTTPSGDPVAMVHCNNCTGELNEWARLLSEFAAAAGAELSMDKIYETMFTEALKGSADGGGLLAFNYEAGEPVTGFSKGCPLFLKAPGTSLSFAGFMRAQLMTALSGLTYGMDILLKEEEIPLTEIYGHGGYVRTPVVGQRLLAAALDTPVSVMETAGEGGPWGMAVLALYAKKKAEERIVPPLSDYLRAEIFAGAKTARLSPEPADVSGFRSYMESYVRAFPAEESAAKWAHA